MLTNADLFNAFLTKAFKDKKAKAKFKERKDAINYKLKLYRHMAAVKKAYSLNGSYADLYPIICSVSLTVEDTSLIAFHQAEGQLSRELLMAFKNSDIKDYLPEKIEDLSEKTLLSKLQSEIKPSAAEEIPIQSERTAEEILKTHSTPYYSRDN